MEWETLKKQINITLKEKKKMGKHDDEIFTFYFIGAIMLFMASLMTGTILGAKTSNLTYLLVPSVFIVVGLILLVGTYVWSRRIEKKLILNVDSPS
jgi:hypothetical protein